MTSSTQIQLITRPVGWPTQDDFRTVTHVHPMGKEPTNAGDRGGPELMFHLEPSKPGFVKLFAQVKVGGKEIFVPFGVMVKPE